MGKQIIRLPVTQEKPGAAPDTVDMGKSRSWQSRLTVNQVPHGYGGSNPSFPRAKDFSILSAGYVFKFREVAEPVMQTAGYQTVFKRKLRRFKSSLPCYSATVYLFPLLFQTAGTSGFWQVGREAYASCLLNNRRRRFSRKFESCTCRSVCPAWHA